MSTFHPFPRLPCELRMMIWKATVEPRTVSVRITPTDCIKPHRLRSTTPVPAVLHTCREARALGLYSKEFTDVNAEPGYIWLNFDIDMVSIGETKLVLLWHVREKIQRLKLSTKLDDSFWVSSYEPNCELIKDFVNLREVHMVTDASESMYGSYSRVDLRSVTSGWPCRPENILFTHQNGQIKEMVAMDVWEDMWKLVPCEEEASAEFRRQQWW